MFFQTGVRCLCVQTYKYLDASALTINEVAHTAGTQFDFTEAAFHYLVPNCIYIQNCITIPSYT